MIRRAFLSAATCCLSVVAAAQSPQTTLPPQQLNLLPGVSVTARCIQGSQVTSQGNARHNRRTTVQASEAMPRMDPESGGLRVYCQNNRPVVFSVQSILPDEIWRAPEKWGQPLPAGHVEYFQVVCPSNSTLITEPTKVHEINGWKIGCHDKSLRLTAHTSMVLG